MVAGLLAIAPITANAGERQKPPPPVEATCTGWEAEFTDLVAAEVGVLTVRGRVRAEASSDGGPCTASPTLVGYEITRHGQVTWSRKAQTTVVGLTTSENGMFSVQLPLVGNTAAICLNASQSESLICVAPAVTDAGTSPGTPRRPIPLLLPADQTGLWEETDPNCGTCV